MIRTDERHRFPAHRHYRLPVEAEKRPKEVQRLSEEAGG